jgi:hypothetical protein
MISTGPIGRSSTLPSKTEVSERLARALTGAAPSAKHVALAVQASADTAEGWRAGNIPTGFNLIALGARYPVYGLEVAALMGIDIDSPRGYAAYLELQRLMIERLK